MDRAGEARLAKFLSTRRARPLDSARPRAERGAKRASEARSEPKANGVIVIEARDITKRYGDFLAVDHVSFTAEAGEVVGFLGPNGAGKTTTMRILTGFLPATDGTAKIDGHDIFEDPLAARRAVGYLPETPPLYPEMDVAGYLNYVACIKDVPRKQRREAVERAMQRCGLGDVRRRVIGALSKGYRQRVGIAQAIVHDPAVLILDEPTVGLDPIQIREIRDLIRDLAAPREGARGHTIVLSTHILAEVEAICRRVIIINRGKKVVDTPLAELTQDGTRLEDVFTRAALRDEAAA
jgi:ABC-2 type transport system ATP-binding protein